MIRATIYLGDEGAAAWALDDDVNGESIRLASGAELSIAAAESAAEDFARRFNSPLGRWTRGDLPGTRIASADTTSPDDDRYTAPAVAAAVSDLLRGAGIDPEHEPERRDRIIARAQELLRDEQAWRETGAWPE